MSSQSFLITGATGKQGGAVAKHLLSRNHTVHALVRNPNSPASLALQDLGATLFQGNFDDLPAISTAAAGCNGLFLNLPPGTGEITGLQRAINILAVAKASRVQHLVFTSGIGIGKQDQFLNWDPKNLTASFILEKQAIEEEIRKIEWGTWTILRPGSFMTNFLVPLASFMFPDLVKEGIFVSAYTVDSRLPLVNPDDIGLFGGGALLNPRRFGGQEVEIAAELMSVEGVVAALAKASGRKIETRYLSSKETGSMKEKNRVVAGQLLMVDLDRWVDMEKVSDWGIPMGSFASFLESNQETVERSIGVRPYLSTAL
jgi:uncharacterized protein YbjT (DUF2867 family)